MERISVSRDEMCYTKEEKESVLKCLSDDESSIFVGNTVLNFEKKLAKYLNVKYAVALPNCTLSIYTALQVLGIQPGDEVLVPNLTHASSIQPIIMSGGKIKVFDFLPNSYYYDIKQIKKLITKNTKFILVCYLYGMPTNIDEIKRVCEDKKILLIEDVAQAFGTRYNKKYLGTIGEIGCYSFNDTKTLRIGEGGALVTNNEKIYNKIKCFIHVGEIFNSSKKTTVNSNTTYGDLLINGISTINKGLNLRPSPVLFSIGLNRLKTIDKVIKKRREKQLLYIGRLSNIKGINFINNLNVNQIDECVPIALWIVLDSKYYDRNKIIVGLLNLGIPVGSFNYNTIINNDYFKKFVVNKSNELNESQKIRDNSIFLPLYESLTLNGVNEICDAFLYVINNYDTEIKIFDKKIYDEEIEHFDGFYLMRCKDE
jgi:dTDP-4-amino-4,6-dideoxygalactose transaminase